MYPTQVIAGVGGGGGAGQTREHFPDKDVVLYRLANDACHQLIGVETYGKYMMSNSVTTLRKKARL